ncbi:MAG: PAS domain S-box protein [Draconibacterium sp.]|nr:PAS domain S-box protein [Draconibacterium sp.]
MIYDKKSNTDGHNEYPEIHQKIIDALPIPIFYRDLNGIYQMCNKAHEKFMGRPKQEIVGKSIHEVHSKETSDIYANQDKELLKTLGEQKYETQIKHNNGITYNAVLNKAVIRDNDNNVIGIVGSINDITELKKTEKRLKKAQESMEVSSRMLHKISAGIVMMDSDFKVVDSNKSFAKLMGEETEELYETIPGLKGADVKVLVPEIIFKMMASILSSGENILERDMKFQNKLLHISVITLYKNKVIGTVIRDMSAPMLVQDEIISRAQRINKQSIETVQKIAYLMGENAAETEELLNSIIEIYRYGDDE